MRLLDGGMEQKNRVGYALSRCPGGPDGLAKTPGMPGQQVMQGDAMGIEVGGLFGLLILAGSVWAIVNILQSRSSTGAKVVWVVFVLLLPLLGLIVWLFAGPRSR